MAFYSFERKDSEDGVRYTFYTDHDLTYIAFFIKAPDFSDYFEGNEYLSVNGWVCGFSPVEEVNKIPADKKVSVTVSQIFQDFLKGEPKKTVLIYHCDDDKGQQLARSRKFNGWFILVSENLNLSIEITEIDIVTGEDVYKHYIGYIFSNSINKESILGEVGTFSQYLLLSLRNKQNPYQ